MQWTRKSKSAPDFADLGENGVDGRLVGHVAMADDGRAELGGEGADTLFQRLALVGKGEFRAGLAAGPRDAPGDRTVVRDAHDEAALARHEMRSRAEVCVSHGLVRPD